MADRMPHLEFFEAEASGEHPALAPFRKVAQALVWINEHLSPRIVGIVLEEIPMPSTAVNFVAKPKWSDGFVGFGVDANGIDHPQPAGWNVDFSVVVDAGTNGGAIESTGPDTCILTPGDAGSESHVHAVYGSFSGDSIEEDWTAPAPSIVGIEVDVAP